MTIEQDDGSLEWTGERYLPDISGNIRLEHVHRYLLAGELAAGRRVLDIACGEGYGTALLARTAAYVVGVDLVPAVVAHARRRYREPNISFAAGSAAAIPLADQSIDLVVSFETLEHLEQHEAMMRDVKRILRPGGVLVISSPDRRQYSDLPNYRNPFHARELYREEFERLLQAHFAQSFLVGQRVKAGSVIGPLPPSPPTGFVTFSDPAGDPAVEARTEGLAAPLYLIGIATDGELPRVPSGLLDGGDFGWLADQTKAIRELLDRHSVEIARYHTEDAARDAAMRTLKEELERHETTVVTLSAQKGRAEERGARLEEETARRMRHLEESERARTDFERLAARLRDRLRAQQREVLEAREAYDRKAAAVDAERSSLEKGIRLWQEHARGLEAERERLEQERHQLLAEIAAIRQVWDAREYEIADLRHDLEVMRNSQSWRVTAPLRGSRRLAGKVGRRVLGRPAGAVIPAPPAPRVTEAPPEPLPPAVTVTQPALRVPPAPASRARPEPPRIDYVPLTTATGVDTRIKAVAFYLPQFHPIPENDAWWGKGFTEWWNVARAQPQFAGHYQPHLPGELGFYDLRLVEIQRRQIELARTYGLHGFCYHHYWFGGTRLLRQPLDQLLANPDLDFPFCLCWANENWTRRWDGRDEDVLIAQQHSPADDLAFIRDLEPALRDPRYIRVDGKPLLVVYRPSLLPDAAATAARWREYCVAAGIGDLFLVATQAFDHRDPHEFGFDAAMEFAPNNMGAPKILPPGTLANPDFSGIIYDYRYLVERARHYESPGDYLLFRSVTPMWDNEARRPGQGAIFAGTSPDLYSDWLRSACRDALGRASDKPFVFINAWNEWAEGAHLEPDRAHGYAYLQATADALGDFPTTRTRPSAVLVSHDAHFYGAQRLALILAQTLSGPLNFEVDILLGGDGPLREAFGRAGRVHELFDERSTPERQDRLIRGLFERGARIALCNTSVVGDTVRRLKSAGFRVVSMIHELPGLIGQYSLESSIATIADCADRVVFPAGVVRDRFVELTSLAPDKAVIRPQGLLADNRYGGRDDGARRDLRQLLGIDASTRIVLGVGSAHLRKGVDLFVDTGLALIGVRDDLAFVWVGHKDGDGYGLAAQRVEQAGAASRFYFPGVMEDIDLFFSGSDVFLLPSREDPFPSVVLHAFDAELPVIAFDDAGGFVELLRRHCGVLVPYLDTQAMADATLRLLDDPAEAARLTTAAKTILTREFGFLDYVRDLVHLAQGPRVSVIVPNYNYARHLPARLRSILTQTYRPHEIVFLDDGSTDDSVQVAESLLATGGIPYRIIRNETNQGVYPQWLRGLHEAEGQLVWIAEADDECAATLLETLVPAFRQPEVVLAYSQSRQIDEHGEELAPDYLQWTADVDPDKWRGAYVRRGTEEIRDSLAVKNTIPNVSAVLMRKPDLSEITAQLLSLKNAGDWLVYVHLLESGDVAFFPQPLNYHRRHGGSMTIGHGGLNLMREILIVQRWVVDRHPIPPAVERKRDAHLQSIYQYLGLHTDGPPAYRDHDALKALTVAG
ncbi:MAG: glycoside hydrolase family 99-like domain-containing protein [Vicinamibacterales bacterium]